MKVNIGHGGRVARAITGTLCVLAGLTSVWFGWPESPGVHWPLGVVLMAAGVFQWFEAGRGWCAVRACGIRTPL